jgi:hypothetical protein
MNGTPIAGAAGPTYMRYNFTAYLSATGSSYSVMVTDNNGRSVTSSSASLTVSMPAEFASLAGRLVALETDLKASVPPGNLVMYDWSAHRFTSIDGDYGPNAFNWTNAFHPQNPSISNDGSTITFGAWVDQPSALQEDLFQWVLGSGSLPTNLTNDPSASSTDPKFSPDNSQIVFKRRAGTHNGTIALTGTCFPASASCSSSVQLLTNSSGSPEASQPAFMPNGNQVVFSVRKTAGDSSSDVLNILDISSPGSQHEIGDGTGYEEQYPVPWSATSFLFTRWVAAGTQSNTQPAVVYSYTFGSGPNPPVETYLMFNLPGCDTQDAFPADSARTLVWIASDCAGSGNYQLYIASAATGHRFALANVDPGFAAAHDFVGPAYWQGN